MSRTLSSGLLLGLAMIALTSMITSGAQNAIVGQQISISYLPTTTQATLFCTSYGVGVSNYECSRKGGAIYGECKITDMPFQATTGLKVLGSVNLDMPMTFYVMADSVFKIWLTNPCSEGQLALPQVNQPTSSLLGPEVVNTTYSFTLSFPTSGLYRFVFLDSYQSWIYPTVKLSLVEYLPATATYSATNNSQIALSSFSPSTSTTLIVSASSPVSVTTYPLATGVPLGPFGPFGLIGIIVGAVGASSVLLLMKKRKRRSQTETEKITKAGTATEKDAVTTQNVPDGLSKLESPPPNLSSSPTAAQTGVEIPAARMQSPTEAALSPRRPLGPKLSTGFEECDFLLQGGIPRGFAVVIVSPPFDERDLFLRRMIASALTSGEKVFYVSADLGKTQGLMERFKKGFVAFCRSAHKISGMENLRDIPDIDNLVEFSILLNKSLTEEQKSEEAKLLIIDLVSDVLVRYRGTTTRKWLADFITKRKAQNFTTICTLSPAISSKEESSRIIELFDGIIEVYEKADQGRLKRFLAIRKMYGQEYSESEIQLERTRLF